jgi:hypothetical protein
VKRILGLMVLLLFSSCVTPFGTRSVLISVDTKTLSKNLNVVVKQGLTDPLVTNNLTFVPNDTRSSEVLFPSLNIKLEITAELVGGGSKTSVRVDITSREYNSPKNHNLVFSEDAGQLKLSCQMPDDSTCNITNLN